MNKYDYIILGAGPSGLSLARSLLDKNIKSFIVLEKETQAGGLCRSEIVDNAPLDIGGGHFLDVTRKNVLDFLFRFLPKEKWNFHKRCSNIHIHGQFVDYPIESNIWQLPTDIQVKYLKSLFEISSIDSSPKVIKKFEKWVPRKFGTEIAENYMLPYNKKLWGNHYNNLSTKWLHKIPNIDFEETLISCIEKSPYGKIPAHTHFYYPKTLGYGHVWEILAKSLKDHLLLNSPVERFDYKNLTINNKYTAKKIINTIPWPNLSMVSNFPTNINRKINKLKSIPLKVDYFPENTETSAHWTYIPNENISHHRILHRHNFVPNSRGYWTETNATRETNPTSSIFSKTTEYSYPVNDVGKDEIVTCVLQWAKENNIHGLGRWGKWEHINSDIAVDEALAFCNEIAQS